MISGPAVAVAVEGQEVAIAVAVEVVPVVAAVAVVVDLVCPDAGRLKGDVVRGVVEGVVEHGMYPYVAVGGGRRTV